MLTNFIFYSDHASATQTDVHWSEKPLSKMTERDWRIFREDFNISYKGNANTLPLRNWDEAGMPEPIRMVSSEAACLVLGVLSSEAAACCGC
jgi:hypothetical protein